jgi:hypothetical protein
MSEWISVKDRLPEDGLKVLTYPGWAEDLSIDEYVTYLGCFLMHVEDNDGHPTHWMALPEPPPK